MKICENECSTLRLRSQAYRNSPLSLSLSLVSLPLHFLSPSIDSWKVKLSLLQDSPLSSFHPLLPSSSEAGNVPTPGNGALAATPGLTVRQVREDGDWWSLAKRRGDWLISRFRRHTALISFTVGALLLSSTYLSRTDGWPRNSRRTFHTRKLRPSLPRYFAVHFVSGYWRVFATVISCHGAHRSLLDVWSRARKQQQQERSTVRRSRRRSSSMCASVCLSVRPRPIVVCV